MEYTKWELVELDKNFWQVQSVTGQIIGIFRKDLLPTARLITSAPDMYEALKQYERMGIFEEFPTYLKGLRNIIAKVEG